MLLKKSLLKDVIYIYIYIPYIRIVYIIILYIYYIYIYINIYRSKIGNIEMYQQSFFFVLQPHQSSTGANPGPDESENPGRTQTAPRI